MVIAVGRNQLSDLQKRGRGVERHPEELSHMKHGESSNPPTSVMHRGTGRDRQVGARALGQRGRRSAAEGLTGEGAEEVPQHPQQREETPEKINLAEPLQKKGSRERYTRRFSDRGIFVPFPGRGTQKVEIKEEVLNPECGAIQREKEGIHLTFVYEGKAASTKR